MTASNVVVLRVQRSKTDFIPNLSDLISLIWAQLPSPWNKTTLATLYRDSNYRESMTA